jgi:hypothetical protein
LPPHPPTPITFINAFWPLSSTISNINYPYFS